MTDIKPLLFPIRIPREIKYEYQEGKANEVKIKCAKGESLMAHEFILFPVDYFRFAIKKFREINPDEKLVQLDFTIYAKETIKLLLDLLYQVNKCEIGVNATLQLIEILYDCDHYTEKTHPWHFEVINILMNHLKCYLTDLGRQKKSELLIGLNSSKLEPLVNLINETCSDVEDKDVLAAAMQFMLDTDNGDKVVKDGVSFLTEKDCSIGLMLTYLRKTVKNLTSGDIFKHLKIIIKSLRNENSDTKESTPFDGDGFKFTSADISGREGPTKSELIAHYDNEWTKNTKLFDSTKRGFQTVTFPKSGYYEITAAGAGSTYGRGAVITGKVKIEKSSKIVIAIGQMGGDFFAGSGGTFVAKQTDDQCTPLVIAGGCGGGYSSEHFNYARTDNFGGQSDDFTSINSTLGTSGDSNNNNGGSGFNEDPKNSSSSSSKCFKAGLEGGKGVFDGGFGGGGQSTGTGTGGGGGGYTGGHGGHYYSGGGGSFNCDQQGTNTVKNDGNGYCIIKFLHN